MYTSGFLLLVAAATIAHQFNATGGSNEQYLHQYNRTTAATTLNDAADPANWSTVHDDLRSSYSAATDTYLASSSVLYGLIGQSSPQEVTPACHRNLLAIYAGIHRRDVWAMKMLDASATAQPGFVWGNQFWLGSRKQCESVQVRKHITLSPRFVRNMKPNLVDARAPFDVNYRMVYASHSSPWQVQVEFLISVQMLHLGVCVPQSCTDRDIHALSQGYLDSGLMEAQNLFVHQANVVHVKDLQLSDAFFDKLSLRIVGVFVLLTVFVVTMATLYEPRLRKSPAKSSAETQPTSSQPAGDLQLQAAHLVEQQQSAAPSALERFVGCFSLRTNLRDLLSTKAAPTTVPTVNAFRSIGCFVILNFHLAWYSFYAISNGAEVFVNGEQLQWQWLATAPLIVDIFFAISGLLLAYNFLQNERKVAEIRRNSAFANLRLFGKQFVHRYLRLTPLYMLVVGGTDIATAYLADKSPFWIADRIDQQCRQSWWRNVLYIQNIFDVQQMCLNWTWSLACEMQYFLICSALLFGHCKWPRAAKRCYVALFAALTVILAKVSVQHKFTPAYDVLHDLGTEMYTTPWVRMLPYVIGVGVGWYLHCSAGQPLPMTRQSVHRMWALATTIMAVCHVLTIMRNISWLVGVPMIMGVRLFYGSSACWMIVASVKGHGGWFARATGWRVFVHLNRLSYGIYLLNPIVVSVIYGLSDHSTAMEPIVQCTTSVGIMVIVYAMSFVCSLLFEMPYMKLSAEILRGSKQKVV